MPLTGTPQLNLTMKSGTTIVSNELTEWTDGTWTLTVPTGLTGPATNVATLNGENVASFDGVNDGDVLQLDDEGYDRQNAFNDAWILEHYVIRMPNAGTFNYISDGAQANDAAFIHEDDEMYTRSGSTEAAAGTKPVDTWAVITVQRVDSGTGTVDIWVDGSKVLTGGSGEIGAGTGVTLGCRGDLSNTLFGEFDLAQYTQYIGAAAAAFSDTEIESNISFLQSEWDLGNSITLTESSFVTVSDSIGEANVDLALSDTVAVNDGSGFDISLLIADTISVTDSAQNANISFTIQDSISISDNISIAKDAIIQLSDSIGVSDSISTLANLIHVSDSVSLAEALNSIDVDLSLSDTVSVTDALASLDNTIVISDAISVNDSSADVIIVGSATGADLSVNELYKIELEAKELYIITLTAD